MRAQSIMYCSILTMSYYDAMKLLKVRISVNAFVMISPIPCDARNVWEEVMLVNV